MFGKNNTSSKAISKRLEHVSLLLSLRGENKFKIQGYQKAARLIKESRLSALALEAALKEGRLKGIGEALSGVILDLISFQVSPLEKELIEEIGASVVELLELPGLGVSKVTTLSKGEGIDSVESLESAIRQGRLEKIKGFGKKTAENLLEAITDFKENKGKLLLNEGLNVFKNLELALKTIDSSVKLLCLGDLKEKNEVISSLEIGIRSNSHQKIFEFFQKLEGFEIEHAEETEINGLFFSKTNLKVNFLSETDYLTKLNEQQKITSQVESQTLSVSDICGVLHAHSTYSDGENSLEEMVLACIDRGYKYFGISDHSKTAFYAGGLKEHDIYKQHGEIDILRKKYPDFCIFKGIESDILEDGSLDYSNDILEKFDFVIASIHSGFSMSIEQMTERVLSAVRHPKTRILAHPSGRLLLKRKPYQIDLKKVLLECSKTNTAIEINANPRRLDLDWRYYKEAQEIGVKFAICPDAHSVDGIDNIQYGVYMAQKGGIKKENIISTWGVEEVVKFFESREKI